MSYWKERMARAQQTLADKKIKQIERQLQRYYSRTAANIIKEFEATYDKILLTVEAGKTPTPADLYKLDKYWQMQSQLRQELNKLGEKQIALLTKQFELQFFDVYFSIALVGEPTYNSIDKEIVTQMINQIWVADGKSWSQRIWDNTELLQQTLNDGLIDCVVTGKKTSDLKKILQQQFNVGYNRADSLVRTEVAHIQTEAAKKRYQDYGVQEVEVFVDEDERTCPVCAKYEGKRYLVTDKMPVPFHPRCRCCMLPVVD